MKWLYWTPRVLSILFIVFLALMSLDVFDGHSNVGNTVLGLLIHNIPAFILIVILAISWNHEIVGGLAFILAGAMYATRVLITMARTGFEWHYLFWILQISGFAFLIGILFTLGFIKKRRATKDKGR